MGMHEGRVGAPGGYATPRVPFVEVFTPFGFVAEGLATVILAVAGWVHRAVCWAVREYQIDRTIRELQTYDDRLLADIGLTRDSVASRIREAYDLEDRYLG